MWKRLKKNEKTASATLTSCITKLKIWNEICEDFQSDYDEVFDYIRSEGEVSWTQMAGDFERCEHCGYMTTNGLFKPRVISIGRIKNAPWLSSRIVEIS